MTDKPNDNLEFREIAADHSIVDTNVFLKHLRRLLDIFQEGVFFVFLANLKKGKKEFWFQWLMPLLMMAIVQWFQEKRELPSNDEILNKL